MKILISGICGFVGRTLAEGLLDSAADKIEIIGIDNLIRPGAWLNRDDLIARGVRIIHGDLRQASDVETVGPVDWVLDAAANPSVLAGVDGRSSSRQLLEHNLVGTINLLEHCKAHNAGFILLSTSRVYGIEPLAALRVTAENDAFVPSPDQVLPAGVTLSLIHI